MPSSKSVTDKSEVTYGYKLVEIDGWDTLSKAQSRSGELQNAGKIAPMSQLEEIRRCFQFALNEEGKNGWKLAGQIDVYGHAFFVLFKEGEKPEYKDLDELLAKKNTEEAESDADKQEDS